MDTSLNGLKYQLFDVIERLKCHDEAGIDPKDTISLDVAKAVIDASKQLVEIAKVECNALRIITDSNSPTKSNEKVGKLSADYAERNGLLTTKKQIGNEN